MACRHHYALESGCESAFSVDSSIFSFGHHVLREVGDHAKDLGMTRIAVFTDKTICKLEFFQDAIQSLKNSKIDFEIYSEVGVEPTEHSVAAAIQFASKSKFDGYISIGGGSVIDTAKVANLYATYPAELSYYMQSPLGKSGKIPGNLKPHIACPTTCGTGTEATAAALFKFESAHTKALVAGKQLRPSRALIDPTTTYTLPKNVIASSGFDILSHALESFTALPYTKQKKPATMFDRPHFQGSNLWSDIGAEAALRRLGKYFIRAVTDSADLEARDHLMLAATLAGTGISTAGTHVPHCMSYSVAGLSKDYRCADYPQERPLVPHGYSVIVNAPSVFRMTATASPERHLQCAEFLGVDIKGAAPSDAGDVLGGELVRIMRTTGAPNGLGPLGFTVKDVDRLAESAFTYHNRLLTRAPLTINQESLKKLYNTSMGYW